MGLLALIIAQILDPIRVGLVLLCVWFVVRTYAPYGLIKKILAYAILLGLVAIVMLVLIEAMHVVRSTADMETLNFVSGYVSNWIIAGIALGLIRLVSGRRRQQHR